MHYLVRKCFPGFSYFVHKFLKSEPGFMDVHAYVGVDVESQIFFTSALIGGEWSVLGPGRFTPGERDPGSH
jgi:hypothetical protein